MTDPATKIIRVLFVDDDRSFLNAARELFRELSGGGWEVLTAADAATTSALLKQEAIDLIVLDVRMPDISGLQLITILNREYPDILKVFLTGLADESERVAGLESGAELFLEKPPDASGYRAIYATLNELARWRRKQGDRGGPSRVALLDLVKLECTSRNSRVFEVAAGDFKGLIFIKEGDIVHAECPGRRGQSAFTHLAALPEAEFSLRQFTEPSERSIYRQWEFLYIDAVKLREQQIQAASEAKARADAEATAPAQVPSPAAAETAAATRPAAAPPPQPPVGQDEEATRQLFQRHRPAAEPGPAARPPAPAPGVAPSPTPIPAPPPASRPAPPPQEPLQLRMLRPDGSAEPPPEASSPPSLSVSETTETPAATSPILETLVCSAQHETLYQWQCNDLDARRRLLDVAREQSDRVSEHLPVGSVDRIELQAVDGRLVIQFQPEGVILMRSSTGIAPGEGGPGQFHQSMAGWLARHGHLRGLLAAGVLRPPQPPANLSCAREYPREALSVAWRCVREVFGAAAAATLVGWQLRWVFEHTQLYVTRRADGKALAMFLTKDGATLDTAGVERVFREFKTLEAL